MARGTLTVQEMTIAGLQVAFTAATATDGDSFLNDGNTYLHVKNGGGSPITVTIQTPVTYGGIALADPTVTVTNGTEKVIGPFRKDIFNQTDGKVYFGCDAVTSVTVAAIRCKPSTA